MSTIIESIQTLKLWTTWPFRLVVGLVAIGVVITQLTGPLLTEYLINRVLVPRHASLLPTVVVGVLILGTFQVGLTVFQRIWFELFVQGRLVNIRLEIAERQVRHLGRLRQSHGDAPVISRIINDMESLAHIVTTVAIEMPTYCLWILGLVVAMGRVNWTLTGVAFLTVPFIVIGELSFSPAVARSTQMVHRRMAEASGDLSESLRVAPVTHWTGTHRQAVQRVSYSLERLKRSQVRQSAWMSGTDALRALLTFFGPLILLVFGADLTLKGQLSIGALLAFYGFSVQLFGPIQGLLKLPTLLAQVTALESGIAEVRPAGNMDDSPLQHDLGKFDPEIIVSHVTVHTRDGVRCIVDDWSVRLLPGRRLWVRGLNGSGKSTLLDVIGQLMDPMRGSVRVRGTVGWSTQPPIIRRDTLWGNVAWGRTDVCHDFGEEILDQLGIPLGNWTDGWDTILMNTAGHDQLSDGEKQIVSLTRALLAKPDILILDEPFNFLSRVGQEGLVRLLKGWSGIVVLSHHGHLEPDVFTDYLDLS